jgi:hypothetical protein
MQAAAPQIWIQDATGPLMGSTGLWMGFSFLLFFNLFSEASICPPLLIWIKASVNFHADCLPASGNVF